MLFRLARSVLLLILLSVSVPTATQAKELNIHPVLQASSQWCFAAAGEMILKHLGYPNLNPAGHWQCGIVAAQGGICMANCAACLNSGGTIHQIAKILISYASLAQGMTGYFNPSDNIRIFGILSADEIEQQIDNDGPIMAGITPTGVPYPPGWGVSAHAVVIIGYEGSGSNFRVIVNDPWAPNQNLYLSAGGEKIQTGQYKIRLSSFISQLKYGNSMTFR